MYPTFCDIVVELVSPTSDSGVFFADNYDLTIDNSSTAEVTITVGEAEYDSVAPGTTIFEYSVKAGSNSANQSVGSFSFEFTLVDPCENPVSITPPLYED